QQEFEAREKAWKERAKTNTDEVLKELGLDPDEFARSRLEKRVAEGKMTPQEREAESLRQENARLKAEQDARAAKEKETQQQQFTQQLERNIQSQLMAAVKRAGLVTGPDTLYSLHQTM